MPDLAREVLPGVWRADVIHPVPGQTCCYILAEKGEGALVDCGAQKGIRSVLDAVAAAGLRPEQIRAIIPTHAHLDHAGAAGNLLRHFPEAELIAHPSTVKHLTNPEDRLLPAVRQLYGAEFFAAEYEGLVAAPKNRSRAAADGETFQLGGAELQIIYTPGHAWNHVSVFVPARDVVFTGDAFGVSYCEESNGEPFIVPVTPPTQFNAPAMRESLDKIHKLSASRAALAHFGVVANSAAVAAKQTAALDEWEKAAEEITEKGGEFAPQFRACLEKWFGDAAGADAAALFRRHKSDLHLTIAGFTALCEKNNTPEKS